MTKIERFDVGDSESKEQLPYIVSGDIVPLLRRWVESKNFVLPAEDFFSRLRDDFSQYMRQIFPGFEFVHEKELTEGIARLVLESQLTPVSLDRVYISTSHHLDITRLVDNTGADRGLGHRSGTPSLLQQFRRLKAGGLNEVVLVDDVIFTGDLIERVIQCLSRLGIQVLLVCAGIGIAEGINRIKGTKREIRCVRAYEEVIDEVCERDFYPGVPLSGRLLVGDNNIGVPYIFPFGKPESWASIPSEYAMDFSRFCIHQTAILFDEVERRSGKPILCQDLGRKVVGLPMDGTPYTDVLRKIL